MTKELRNLMAAYRENLQYIQELQKQSHDMGTKPRSYVFSKKVGWTVNTSKPNAIRSWKQSYLGFFEFYTY